MEIIICMITLVGLVSLYDYFSARKWQQVTSSERNDIVFEKRNKEYGAFVMRRDYDLRVVLIMASMIFAIGSAYGIYKIIQNLPEEVVEEPPIDMSQFTMVAPPLDEEIPPPPPEEEIPPLEKTIQFLPPVITDDEVETEVVIQDEVEEVKASTETNETETENFEIAEKKKEPEVEKKEEIFTYVDESAEFPGGAAAMKKFLAENINYPQTAIELGISGKCYMQFIVNEGGRISQVTVQRGVPDCPECDKEAVRVVKSMPPWRPGKNNGKAVNSYFNLPVNFTLK